MMMLMDNNIANVGGRHSEFSGLVPTPGPHLKIKKYLKQFTPLAYLMPYRPTVVRYDG